MRRLLILLVVAGAVFGLLGCSDSESADEIAASGRCDKIEKEFERLSDIPKGISDEDLAKRYDDYQTILKAADRYDCKAFRIICPARPSTESGPPTTTTDSGANFCAV